MEIDRDRKPEGRHRLDPLRCADDAASIEAIGYHTAGKHQEELRDRVRESDETEEKGGIGEVVDEPPLRDALHPRADVRDELCRPEKTVIPLAKCLKSHSLD